MGALHSSSTVRNSDWSNYDRSAMQSGGSSGSNQPCNAFGNNRESSNNRVGSDSWANWRNPAWVIRNKRAKRNDDDWGD